MRRVAQAPSHYEVELHQPASGNDRTETIWRAIKRVGPDGSMAPLTFGRLEAAQAYARRVNPGRARIVAVEHGGWRRVVDEAGT